MNKHLSAVPFSQWSLTMNLMSEYIEDHVILNALEEDLDDDISYHITQASQNVIEPFITFFKIPA